MGYFQKTFKPDIIDGDVSKVIQSNKTDLAFALGDILFDWQPIDIPLGTDAIVDGLIHMFGTDGGSNTDVDLQLLIAKSNNGVAPTTLGEENAAVTGCFELPDILIGAMKFEGDTAKAGVWHYAFGSIFNWNNMGASGQGGPLVIQPENNHLGGQTTNRIYVAALAGGNFNFSTGVLLNDGSDVADDAGTSLTVDGVDPRQAFRPGDVLYIHDVDTPIGTISSLAATTITLTSNNVGAISNNDEFMNASPIRVTLGFQGR